MLWQLRKLLATEIDTANWPNEAFKLMVSLSAGCGLRRSEVLGLRWRNINFEKAWLFVEENFVAGRFEDLKSGKSHRVVGIGPTLAHLLREHQLRVRGKDGGFGQDGLVFDRGGSDPVGLPYDPTGFTVKAKALLRAAGLPENVTLHGLRHTNGSVLMDEGAEPYKVSQRLGHSDLTVTTGTHAHQIPKSVSVEAEIIERVMFGSE